MTASRLHLFEGYGVELEYMIVDRDSLDVRPISDTLLQVAEQGYVSELERGAMAWSNELALHVLELKTNGPASQLEGLDEQFHQEVAEVNRRLEPAGARLLPTAMHPWMDAHREFHIWPHEYNEVYESYHRIFDCRGHGWANLQSVHLNLPFADDREFARLHAAIRLVLPLLPALAASSPFADGQLSPSLDMRMEFYRANSRRIKSITGEVVPEAVYSRSDYEREILERMYRDIRPLDPNNVLQHEWLNSRGAIARFDRHAIEIRVLDVQECPRADLAICSLIVETLKALIDQPRTSIEEQQAVPTECLSELFVSSIRTAQATVVDDPRILKQFGLEGRSVTAGELWQTVYERTKARLPAGSHDVLETILSQGSLAARIVDAWGQMRVAAGDAAAERGLMRELYRRLADCLVQNRPFDGSQPVGA